MKKVRVRCIDAGGQAIGKLVKGKEYDATNQGTGYNVEGTFWRGDRFEVVGDALPKFVKCIRPNDSGTLIKGRIYQIKTIQGSESNKQFHLLGVNPSGLWDGDRFEEVSGLIVRCMRDINQPDEYTEEQKLKKDWLYQAEIDPSSGGMRYKINGVLFYNDRFEIVFDPVATAQTIPVPKRQGPIDVEEERIWAAWTAPAPGNCKCNVPPPCPYHPRH